MPAPRASGRLVHGVMLAAGAEVCGATFQRKAGFVFVVRRDVERPDIDLLFRVNATWDLPVLQLVKVKLGRGCVQRYEEERLQHRFCLNLDVGRQVLPLGYERAAVTVHGTDYTALNGRVHPSAAIRSSMEPSSAAFVAK